MHTFWNFKWLCIMLYAKPWEHPSAIATLSVIILLSAWINSSTHCTVASVAISTGRPGRASSATFQHPRENFLTQLWTVLCQKTLPTIKKQHFFMNILCIESFWLQKTHKRMLLFDCTLLKHGCHFDYCNQPLNMRMCVFYLDSHEAGLCCYLVIHIGNIASTAAVLLSFLTYLLTLPHTSNT
jgi:hypothetical protein